MYSKQEAAQLKQEFWTAFGQYMRPIPSAGGEPVNWVNYKTGEKHIYFRTHADGKAATVAIELHHPDSALRQLYLEQFQELAKVLEATAAGPWQWQQEAVDEYGKMVARIYTSHPSVSIFKREDWPSLITFFKRNLMALDEFWSGVKYAFETLRS